MEISKTKSTTHIHIFLISLRILHILWWYEDCIFVDETPSSEKYFTYNSAYPGRRTAFGDKTDVLRSIHPNDSHSIWPDPTDRGEVIVSEKSTAVYDVILD